MVPLLLLGLGDAAHAVLAESRRRGETRPIAATTRQSAWTAEIAALGVTPIFLDPGLGPAAEDAVERAASAAHVIVSLPPDGHTDRTLATWCRHASSVVYVSSTAIYGARSGVIDAATEPAPTPIPHISGRSRRGARGKRGRCRWLSAAALRRDALQAMLLRMRARRLAGLLVVTAWYGCTSDPSAGTGSTGGAAGTTTSATTGSGGAPSTSTTTGTSTATGTTSSSSSGVASSGTGTGGAGGGCAGGLTLCGSDCVDLQSDPAHCGACGVACSATYVFDPASQGVTGKGVAHWAYDVKNQGPSVSQIAADVANAGGSARFDAIRVAWYPQYPLQSNGTLDPQATAAMDAQIADGDLVGATYGLFLSPKSANIDPYYVNNGKIVVARWVNAMERARDYYQAHGKTIHFNGPTNEPDNTGGKFSPQTFVDIRAAMTGWGAIPQIGPCTFQSDKAPMWLAAMDGLVAHATTHAIGATTRMDYEGFFDAAALYDLTAWNSEIHSLAEALIGADRGMTRGVWWAAITAERGMFVQASSNPRFFYGLFGAFGAVAGYGDGTPNGMWIFIGNKDPSNAYTLRFTSATSLVSFDGAPPGSSDTVDVPPSAELLIHATW